MAMQQHLLLLPRIYTSPMLSRSAATEWQQPHAPVALTVEPPFATSAAPHSVAACGRLGRLRITTPHCSQLCVLSSLLMLGPSLAG